MCEVNTYEKFSILRDSLIFCPGLSMIVVSTPVWYTPTYFYGDVRRVQPCVHPPSWFELS